MAWEQRGNRRYLYRSVRTADGRVRKVYVGRGPAAQGELALRTLAETLQAIRAGRSQALMTALAQRDAELDRFDASVKDLVKQFLTHHGYYKHHGQWRTRHDSQARTNQADPPFTA